MDIVEMLLFLPDSVLTSDPRALDTGFVLCTVTTFGRSH